MAKTTLVFSSLSSKNTGTRDVAIDFTKALETSETISSVTVTSSDTSVLTISGAAKNSSPITKDDGTTIATGKGVQFQLTTVAVVTKRDVIVDVIFTGNSGTKETYEAIVPIVDKKRE